MMDVSFYLINEKPFNICIPTYKKTFILKLNVGLPIKIGTTQWQYTNIVNARSELYSFNSLCRIQLYSQCPYRHFRMDC
jgi:hypothetical protein